MKRLAIIGLGLRARYLLDALNGFYHGRYQVVGIIDPEPEKALARLTDAERAGVTIYENVRQLILKAKPDGVIVATRCDLHAPYLLELRRYSVPVFLEKPVAINEKQAMELEKALPNLKPPVCVSFPLIATPLFKQAKQLIQKQGELHHLLSYNYVNYGDVYFDSWYKETQITGGLLLQKATHDFHYLMKIVGAPIQRVSTMARHGRYFKASREIPKEKMNEDSSSSLVEFANGVQGVYTQVFCVKNKSGKRGAIVSGQKGSVKLDWYPERIEVNSHIEETRKVTDLTTKGNHWGGDIELMKNFIGVIDGKAKPLATLAEGLESVYACLAAKKSVCENRQSSVRLLKESEASC